MATLPTIPNIPAGYNVQVADMNNLAACASFLLNKPMARIHDASGGQAISATTATVVTMTAKLFDTDSMWNTGASPYGASQLTVNTPGFYKVNYSAALNGHISRAQCSMVTGPNNPQGSGITLTRTAGSSDASTASAAAGSGVWPYYTFVGDYFYVTVYSAASATQRISDVESFLAMEWISM